MSTLMSRADMHETIRKGGAVMLGGKVHTDVRTLPPEHELAANDVKRAQQALAGVQEQIENLRKQEAKLLATFDLARARQAAKEHGQPGDLPATAPDLDGSPAPGAPPLADAPADPDDGPSVIHTQRGLQTKRRGGT